MSEEARSFGVPIIVMLNAVGCPAQFAVIIIRRVAISQFFDETRQTFEQLALALLGFEKGFIFLRRQMPSNDIINKSPELIWIDRV